MDSSYLKDDLTVVINFMKNPQLPFALSVFRPLRQFHQRLGFNQGSVLREIPPRNGMLLAIVHVRTCDI